MRSKYIPNHGGVYILSYRELPLYYKIGRARDFRSRFMSYKTHVPFQIDIHLMYPTIPYDPCKVDGNEELLIEMLEDFRWKGEWFHNNAYSTAIIHELQNDIGFKPFAYSTTMGAEYAELLEQLHQGNLLYQCDT